MVPTTSAGNKSGVKLTLYSLKGQKVKEVSVPADANKVSLQLDGLSADLYMLEIEIEGKRLYQKVMIVK